MKTFIQVTEIWVPTQNRSHLVLANGIYGMLNDFKSASEQTSFEYGQGLPGKAWEQTRPIVITDLAHSCFRRTEAATQAGLTSAIAIPVFSGEYLMSVIVFLCGDDEEHAGAIEVWANDADRSNELGVIEGYYGKLDYFEFISRKTKIMKGFGLPGQVWEQGLPVLMADLGASQSFIRGRDAKNAGITTALGIPMFNIDDQVCLLTLLSAKATPIARQIEIWLLDHQTERLVFKEGYNEKGIDLAEIYATKTITKGQEIIGRVWLTGIPVIVDKYDVEESIATLVMPVINQGKLIAVVVFCL
jgi:hypothetical protein